MTVLIDVSLEFVGFDPHEGLRRSLGMAILLIPCYSAHTLLLQLVYLAIACLPAIPPAIGLSQDSTRRLSLRELFETILALAWHPLPASRGAVDPEV